MITDGLLFASTSHSRHVQTKRVFTYEHFMFALDLLNLEQYEALYPLMGFNRSGFYNFRFEDHYILKSHGLSGLSVQTEKNFGRTLDSYKQIILITNLRSLGYVFNPISVYICLRKDTNSEFDIIYEVGNTFGEQKYFYTSRLEDIQAKEFYVSPFIQHQYDFKFQLAIETSNFVLRVITQTQEAEPILTASMNARMEPLTKKTILSALFRHPLINFKVIFLIHFQALLLYLKRMRFYRKSEFSEHQRNYHKLKN